MRKPLLEIELRGNRLFAISSHLGHKTELDVTSMWHFCKEAILTHSDDYLIQNNDEKWKRKIEDSMWQCPTHGLPKYEKTDCEDCNEALEINVVLGNLITTTVVSTTEPAPCRQSCKWKCFESLPNVHDCGCHGGQENLTQEQSSGLGYYQP